MNIMLILGIGIVAAFAVGYWNFRATIRAGRCADWRTNRDGLRAPGTSQDFNRLHMISWPVLIALVVFHASPTAVLLAALAYAIGFAALADRDRRRAIVYYRGNVLNRS